MTFIGIACKGDTAEVAFDEGSYTEHAVKVRRTTKVVHFHHLDALLTASGNPRFTWPAQRWSWTATMQAENFDELVHQAPHWLQNAVDESGLDVESLGSAEEMSGTVYLVGWSDRAQEFEAYQFTPTNLAGEKVVGVLVRPTPYSLRCPTPDLKRIIKGLRRIGFEQQLLENMWTDWSTNPLPAIPQTDADWIQLATLAREERAMQGAMLRTFVSGTLHLTTLRRGGSETRALHKFNDTDPEAVRRMVSGSLHPVAQLLPCTCEPDNTLTPIECCYADLRDQACMCGSERTFEQCCMVTDADDVPEQFWTSPFPY